MLFDYTAKNRQGAAVRGVVVADSEPLAADLLRERGMGEVLLSERAPPSIWTFSFDFLERVSPKDLVAFSRQLAVMSAAGVPMVQALKTLSGQTANRRLSSVIVQLAEDVEGGSRLSDAMAAQSSIFSNFTVNMIRSGETTGRLSQVLEYLADQSEKDYDLRSKIRGAMMYPAFVVSGMVVVGFLMITFVIPKLTDVLKESGAELPLATRLLIAVASFFSHFWYLVLILSAAVAGGLIYALKTERGRLIWDTLKIRAPIFGKLLQHIYVVRFTRSLQTLLSGGVDMVAALGAAAEIVSNAVYRELILATQKEVEDGNSITTVFATQAIVPTMVTEMLAVGENTGKIQEILGRLTDFYTREINNLVTNLVTLIEPMIMVLMGLAVGVMVSAVILPMYSLANSF